jgi:hypothetical protein
MNVVEKGVNMNGKIYCIRNHINDKLYIGQTIRTVEARFKEHIKVQNYETGALHNAIVKHGGESFYVELVEDGIQTMEELNRKEIYYIDYFKSYTEGYNSNTGGAIVANNGVGVYQLDLETGEIIKKFKSSAEAGRETGQCSKNILKCVKGLYQQAGGYRWVRVKEYEGYIHKPLISTEKPVLMIDLITGEVVKEFKSLTEASKKMGVQKGNISSACSGRLDFTGGYKWEHKLEERKDCEEDGQ